MTTALRAVRLLLAVAFVATLRGEEMKRVSAQQTTGAVNVSVHVPYTQFTLANGLNVILHRDPSAPLVSVNVWYHVGSANERPGRTGFAHLFEHVMFEGSAHVPEGDFDRRLEAVGGVNNGSTSPDRTNYWEDVPASGLELALWLEADRMGWLLDAMDQDKLDLQRDVVMNERRQSYENRPYGLAWETLLAALYPPEHPYHWPVIGSMEDLAAATLDDVRAFFRTYYSPGNASLVVAGDISLREGRRLVERYFADVPAGTPPAPVLARPAPLSRNEYRVLEDRVPLPRIYVAWHGPPAYSEGDAALDAVASVLAEGRSSRLYQELVHRDRVAQSVSAFHDGGLLGGRFTVVATASPDVGLGELERRIRAAVARIASDPVSVAELDRVKAAVETDLVGSLDRVGGFDGKADRLNEYFFYRGDPGFVRDDLARTMDLSPSDLTAAAAGHLTRPAAVVSVVPTGRTDLAAGDPGAGPS